MTNIIILFCSILAGFLVGKHFEKGQLCKGQFFADLHRYAILLKSNVKSRRIELSSFNLQFAQTCSQVFANFLMDKSLPSCLSKSQKQFVCSFFASINATSTVELLNNLDYYEQLISMENSAISNAFRNCSVCSKLGILCGVIVGILFM